jgi:hypothetical protein
MKKIIFILFVFLSFACYDDDGNRLWIDGKIPYRAIGFSIDEYKELRSCMVEWSIKTEFAVEFIDVDLSDADHESFITIIRYDVDGGGGWTGPGENISVSQYYLFGDEYCSRSSSGETIDVHGGLTEVQRGKCHKTVRYCWLHELGHIIGLEHEHQRPDRDDYITILVEAFPEDKGVLYFSQVYMTSEPRFYDYRKYDYDYNSIMHYRDTNVIDFRGHDDFRDEVSVIDAQKVIDLYSPEGREE